MIIHNDDFITFISIDVPNCEGIRLIKYQVFWGPSFLKGNQCLDILARHVNWMIIFFTLP